MKLPKGSIIAIDTETTGLDPYQGHRIFCWAYMTNEGEYGFFEKSQESMLLLCHILFSPEKTVVFHNAKFDLSMLLAEDVDVFNLKCSIEDTLILSKLSNENGSHKLRDLASRLLNRNTDDKDEIDNWLKQNRKNFTQQNNRAPNFSDVPKEIVSKRCLWDVESTLLLYAKLRSQVSSCEELYQTEKKVALVCIKMEHRGMTVDISRARHLKKYSEQSLKKLQEWIDRICCPCWVEKSKGKQKLNTLNCNSRLELEAAFNKVGIELKYQTKPKKGKKGEGVREKKGGGNWSFDEYAMIRYIHPALAQLVRESGEEGWKFERFMEGLTQTKEANNLSDSSLLPVLILKIREMGKMISTYYNHLIEQSVDKRKNKKSIIGTLHCHFNPSEALTGRTSSSNPNLQNMPRLLGPRECFIPRPGYMLVHFDYEQVEMKFFTHFAQDQSMAESIRDDIHRYVASKIYHLPKEKITKEQRKRAKQVNFGILYGAGAGTIAETLTKKGLPTSYYEAKKLVANYHASFPSVHRVTNRLKSELIREGHITNPFGRRYHIPSAYAYTALNYNCQGTPADLIKQSMVKVDKWLKDHPNYDSHQVMLIHDELVLEVPISKVECITPEIVRLLENKNDFFLPITVGIEVTKSRWSQKKELT